MSRSKIALPRTQKRAVRKSRRSGARRTPPESSDLGEDGARQSKKGRWRRANSRALVAELQRRAIAREPVAWKTILDTPDGWSFLSRAKFLFGSWSGALAAAGLDPSGGRRSPWPTAGKATVLAEIRRREQAGKALNYKGIRQEKWGKPFLERAEHFFGSWSGALLAAGLEPKWGRSPWPTADKATVLGELRRRMRAGEPLGYDAIAREPWGQALRKRCRVLFGTWAAALWAAGIEPGKEVSRWPRADEAVILSEIRRRHRARESLRYKAIEREKWGGPLLKRAETLFGSWSIAVLSAGLDLPRGMWSPWPKADQTEVLAEIRRRKRAGESLRWKVITKEQWGDPFLKRAKALFGSWQEALRAAGVRAAGG